MRGIAKALGYKLNQNGLYNIKNNKLIVAHSESDIFKLLNVKYVDPKDR